MPEKSNEVTSYIQKIEISAGFLNEEEKLAFYAFAAKAMCIELTAEKRNDIWRLREEDIKDFDFPIPASCFEKKVKDFSLEGVYVLSTPYSPQKMVNAVIDIHQEGFRQEQGNYEAMYYPELNLATVINGVHHLSVAPVSDIAKADVEIYSLKKAAEIMTTDGEYWYVVENGKTNTYPVKDAKMAILYILYLKSVGI